MKEDREHLLELCKDLLEGRKGVIETSREMMRWRFSIGPESDPDFLVFTGIDSETDHIPLGSVRKNWQVETLQRKDLEIQEAEEFFRSRAEEAAASLIRKYKIEPNTPPDLVR